MHAPKSAVAPFRKKFPQFENKIGKYKGPNVKNPIAAFAGMMTYMDKGIGEVMALLKELDIDDKTIVLFTSDNGPHLEGGHDPRFFNSNGPLRGFKRDLYEGGIRVPLIARWPRRIKAGSTSNHICAHWDLMPTFCELAGAKTPTGIDGISMVPTMLGKNDEQKQHAYLYWEFIPRGGKQAVRVGQWKGVRKNVAKNRDAPIELYDLSKDIGETNDVAKDYPIVVLQMKHAMEDAHVESPIFKLFGN
jgi:arylsulfatase A-like enzyme